MQETLADKAYRILEDKIVRLIYKPGELISEKQLSEELGIGRMPIREAIKRLESAHLIKIMPRRGMMVTEIKLEEMFLQIEVRRLLEGLMVRRAAKYATKDERKQFLEIAKKFKEVTENGDPDASVQVDNEFNLLVAESSRNPFAASGMMPLHALARRQYYYQYDKDEKIIDQINDDHVNLMHAIAAGEEDNAAKICDHLIDCIAELYKKNYMQVI